MDTKNNTIEKINDFFLVDINQDSAKLLDILHQIISYDTAIITISGKTFCKKGNKPAKYKLKANLCIRNAIFGEITLTRDHCFTREEKSTFTTCTSIISNIIKDIEISKVISLQLKALQEGILESDKAYKTEKNKNDLFANFSHELKTPLNSIISSSELLSAKIFGDLNEKQAEYISDIRVAGIHLLGMINDILDLSKIEAKSMQLNNTHFDIVSAFNEVCNIVKPIAEKKNIRLIKKYKSIKVCADYQKIQQILFNLISNAIKYTPENGQIELITKQNDQGIEISIKDNGIGIAKKYHTKIFKKFVQLNSAKDSNGLGLTITKELVKLHGGSIWVISELNKGSTFSFTIPKSLELS